MCQKYLPILISLWLAYLPSLVFAQGKKNENKNKKEISVPNAQKILDSLGNIDSEVYYFKNLNKVPYYFDEKKIAAIGDYETARDDKSMHAALYEYVLNFGVENFYRNTFFLWKLGKLSENLGYNTQAKSLYRLVLKHHRSGNIATARLYYDSLSRNDADYYLPVEYYYDLIDARKAIDERYAELKADRRSVSKEVNDSLYSDYGPALSKKNGVTLMVFTSKRNIEKMTVRSMNILDSTLYANEDLYLTTKLDTFYIIQTERGSEIDTVPWTRTSPLSRLNTTYNEGSACVNKKGDKLFFSRCDSPDGIGSCDLYVAEKIVDSMFVDTKMAKKGLFQDFFVNVEVVNLKEESNGTWYYYHTWGNEKNLGLNVNSISWESHPCLSHQEDTLFFASDRIGGFGMSDIYFTCWDGKEWGSAQNIGPIINTRFSEVSPFYHPKFQVLYFSSNGQLVNFGNTNLDGTSLNTFDLYKSYHVHKKVILQGFEHDISYFTEPKNIGPLINQESDEYYFTIDEKSELIYFAKMDTTIYTDRYRMNDKWVERKIKVPNLNLYSFPLPMEAQPEATTVLKGNVIDSLTGEILKSKGIVLIIDLDNGIEIAPKYTRDDGTFEYELIKDNRYLIVITGEDFFRVEREFILEGDTTIRLETTEMKFKKWKFEALEFESARADISAEMEPDLDKLVTFLIDHPHLGLEISGHTDGLGDPDKNLQLSQSRADAIKKYIISKGKIITEDRINAIGYGNSRPIIAQENGEDERRVNRRVEFEIIRLEQ